MQSEEGRLNNGNICRVATDKRQPFQTHQQCWNNRKLQRLSSNIVVTSMMYSVKQQQFVVLLITSMARTMPLISTWPSVVTRRSFQTESFQYKLNMNAVDSYSTRCPFRQNNFIWMIFFFSIFFRIAYAFMQPIYAFHSGQKVCWNAPPTWELLSAITKCNMYTTSISAREHRNA